MTSGRVIDLTAEEARDASPARSDHDFERFYDDHLPRVRGLVRKLVNDRSAVDDVVQETFLRAYNSGLHLEEDGEHPHAQFPWLATVARNIVLDMSRRTHGVVHGELEETELPPEVEVASDDPEAFMTAVRRRQGIVEALEAVCERHRRILLMKHVEGKRYEDIAALEGISMEALKSVLRRARRTFQESYAEVAERQGLGVLVGGGILSGVRARLRGLRDRLVMSAEAVNGSVAITSQGIANAVMTAAVVGAVMTAGPVASFGDDGRTGETETAPVAAVSDAMSVAPLESLPVVADYEVAEDDGPVETQMSVSADTPAAAQPVPASEPQVQPADTETSVSTDDLAPVAEAPASGSTSTRTSGDGSSLEHEDSTTLDLDDDGNDDLASSGDGFVGCPPPEHRGDVTAAVCPVVEAGPDAAI